VWPSSATAAAFRSGVSGDFQRQGNADDAAPGTGAPRQSILLILKTRPGLGLLRSLSVKVLASATKICALRRRTLLFSFRHA